MQQESCGLGTSVISKVCFGQIGVTSETVRSLRQHDSTYSLLIQASARQRRGVEELPSIRRQSTGCAVILLTDSLAAPEVRVYSGPALLRFPTAKASARIQFARTFSFHLH